MILIISHDSIDEPTNDVIDWLNFYNADFLRINGDDFYLNKNFIIDYDDKIIKFGDNLIKIKWRLLFFGSKSCWSIWNGQFSM